MVCKYRIRMNNLWSIWYVILMVPLQAYLIYAGLRRYHLYRTANWPDVSSIQLPLDVYLTLYYICVPFLIILAICGVFKSGNVAGDNEKFGAQTDLSSTARSSGKTRSCLLSRALKALWEHGPPLPQQLHVLIALCQIFAQQLMMAQVYRYHTLDRGSANLWSTELDFVYQREFLLHENWPLGNSRLHGIGHVREFVQSPIGPKLLPVLMHIGLFGLPLEFVNLIAALIAYCCCYSSVFWRVSKSFSFLFSLYLFIHSATVIWTYLGFSVLYRNQEVNYANTRSPTLGHYLPVSKYLIIYHPVAIIATYTTTIILMSIAPIAMYTYGYNKFLVNLFNAQYRSAARCQSSLNGHSNEYMDCRRKNYHMLRSPKLCCEGYAPHIIAILLLILIVAVKAPTIYALMVLFQHTGQALLLTCIVVDISYLFTWIIFWLILTLKRDWEFKVLHNVSEIVSIQNAHHYFVPASSNVLERTTPDLKNSLLVMHGDQLYVTDDHIAKQSILRHVQQNAQNSGNDEVYWLGANGHSPVRKNFVSESAKGTPEMKRLLGNPATRRASSDENSTLSAAYHTISRTGPNHRSQEVLQQRNNGTSKRNLSFISPEDVNTVGTFGTLQRNQKPSGGLLLGQQQMSNQKQMVQKTTDYGITPSVAEAYATVHKPMQRDVLPTFPEERKISSHEAEADTSTYSNFTSGYATYARLPQQGNASQRYRPEEDTYSSTTAGTSGLGSKDFYGEVTTPRACSCREQHPIKRTSNLKLSSFNSSGATPIDPSKQSTSQVVQSGVASSWSQQKNSAQMQPLNLQWNDNSTYTKTSSISTASTQQEQSGTPSSTLTSQGSVSNYGTQPTPIPGSPGVGPSHDLYGSYGGARYGQRNNGGIYGTLVEGMGSANLYGTLTDRDGRMASTSQKQLRVMPPPHHNKTGSGSGREDSANYSLTSSNDSADNHRGADANLPPIEYATSVV